MGSSSSRDRAATNNNNKNNNLRNPDVRARSRRECLSLSGLGRSSFSALSMEECDHCEARMPPHVCRRHESPSSLSSRLSDDEELVQRMRRAASMDSLLPERSHDARQRDRDMEDEAITDLAVAQEEEEGVLGPPPASQAALNSLSRRPFTQGEVEEEQNNNNNNTCGICLEAYVVGATTVTRLPCGHRYHAECVELWLQRHCTCPTCRYELAIVEDHDYEMESLGLMWLRKIRNILASE